MPSCMLGQVTRSRSPSTTLRAKRRASASRHMTRMIMWSDTTLCTAPTSTPSRLRRKRMAHGAKITLPRCLAMTSQVVAGSALMSQSLHWTIEGLQALKSSLAKRERVRSTQQMKLATLHRPVRWPSLFMSGSFRQTWTRIFTFRIKNYSCMLTTNSFGFRSKTPLHAPHKSSRTLTTRSGTISSHSTMRATQSTRRFWRWMCGTNEQMTFRASTTSSQTSIRLALTSRARSFGIATTSGT